MTLFGLIACEYGVNHETIYNILNKVNKIDTLEKLIYFISHTSDFNNLDVKGGDIPYLEQIISQRGIQIDKKKLNKPKNKALILIINYLKTK